MKKIGIISMQRTKNYGSFWQAYGLKKILSEIGERNIEFVDYRIGEQIVEKNDEVIFNAKFSKKDSILRKIYGAYFKILYEKIWLNKYLNIKGRKNYSNNYDMTIIGSDEVFNCTQPGKKIGFSKDLFGSNRKNVISYAASFGFTTIERLKKFKLEEEVSFYLKKMKEISVRDENSYNIVKKLINKSPTINLDPVLISNINTLDLPKVSFNNYIIVYAYTGRISNNEKKKISEFAKKNNKKIISLGYYHDFVDRVIICNPFKVLSFIKYADYVITDTFHGTIFSIIFEKKFVTIIRNSNKEKLSDLLNRLCLINQSINNLEDLDKLINNEIDYENISKIIKKERLNTINYLRKNLGE